MICKFFRGGRTKKGARNAIKYLLNDRVNKGQAKVIIGNPNTTLKIISSIENKSKFSSGVMSFEETISDEMKREIIGEFEKTFFAGLEEDQYNLLVVEHNDKNRTELHFIIPKVELRSGLSFNPYFVKKDFAKKDLFQDYINAKYQLSSPHQEDKQQITKEPNPNWEKDELKKWVDDFVIQNIEQGLIKNADDVAYLLEQSGFKIGRHGKEYIGLEIDGKKFRMKGKIYGKDFTGIGAVAEATTKRARQHIPITQTEFRELESKYRKTIQEHAQSTKKRYSVKQSKSTKRSGTEVGEHRLGIGAVHDKKEVEMVNIRSRSRDISNNRNNISHDRNNKYTNKRKHNKKSNNLEVLRDDRIRKQTIRIVRAREARARAREERLLRYAKANAKSTSQNNSVIRAGIRRRKLRGAIRKILPTAHTIAHNVAQELATRIKANTMKELNQFKEKINIAEFAQVFGYSIDKKKSSMSAKQLRNENGDKIVVMRNKENGHYVYFNMWNSSDKGSIVDFIQNRTKKNLGQVRKMCRQFINGELKEKVKEQVKITSSSYSRQEIVSLWNSLSKGRMGEDYRGIDADVYHQMQERNRLRIGADGLYFMMVDGDGICGIEKRGADGSKHIIKGSEKGLWTYGRNISKAKKVVITESPFDAVSYQQLSGEDDVFLISTMGTMSESGKESLKRVFEKLESGTEVILAVDNDRGGDLAVEAIMEVAKKALNKDSGVKFLRHKPRYKDWNEDLQESQIVVRQRQSRSYGGMSR